jgi:phosphinothricin acetyltransferase
MRIRTATVGDAEEIAAIYAPIVRDTVISFESEPPDATEIAGRISKTLETHPWLVAEIDRRVAGYVYAGPHRARPAYRWSADVTVYVHDDFRRRGVGSSLYRALLEILERQNLHMAWAGITLPNPGSVAVHEAVGFEHVGTYREVGHKFGAWRDVGWWGRRIGEPGREVKEPVAFRDLT